MPHLCHIPIKTRFYNFSPKNGFWSQFVIPVLPQSNSNEPALCPYSLNDQLAYLKNGHVLKKCPGNGNNITDHSLFNHRPHNISILGHFGPFSSPTAARGAPQRPFLNSYCYLTCLRSSFNYGNVPKMATPLRKMPQNV